MSSNLQRSLAVGLFPLIGMAACSLGGQTGSSLAGQEASLTSLPTSPVPSSLPPTAAATPQEPESPTPAAPYPSIEASTLKPGQNEYSYRSDSGDLINYLLFVPTEYDPGDSWPLIVYLHGYRGLGGSLVILADEPFLRFLEMEDEFGFIVVSPQLPEGFWPKYFERIDHLIAHLLRQLPIDDDRIYLTGFSLGGAGAWQLALRSPNRFAAVAPVAGAPSPTGRSIPANLCDLKGLPIWVFHSDADTIVIVDADVAAVDTLETCGGEVRFSRYSDLTHPETGLKAYGNSDLYAWFLEHAR